MPYALRKAPNQELYWVVNRETKHKYSKKPIPLDKAKKQKRLLDAIDHGFIPSKNYKKNLEGGENEWKEFFDSLMGGRNFYTKKELFEIMDKMRMADPMNSEENLHTFLEHYFGNMSKAEAIYNEYKQYLRDRFYREN